MTGSQSPDTATIGPTDLRVSQLGIGAWAWGGRFYWGSTDEDDMRAAFEAGLAGGINFFDTAEMYGSGRSETFVGRFLHAARHNGRIVVATKFFPYPWRLAKGTLMRALRRSLARLGLGQVDLYQIHWPSPPMPVATWVTALADVIEAGLARYGGVSNYNVEQTRLAHAILGARGIPLASNQVSYSLLNRGIEHSGLLDACRELGVTVIAYSPLAQGLLTGKYTPENPPPGMRSRRYNRDLLAQIRPLVDLLREIGQAHGSKTPAQVALNWAICKGTLPIPGAKNARQAQDNAGALGWRLTTDEVAALDAEAGNVT
jgi:aryl-alcohol dehydrogenase-like predicted oxidoreductase